MNFLPRCHKKLFYVVQPLNPDIYFQQVELSLPKERAFETETFLLKTGAIGCYELLYQEGVSNLAQENTTIFFFFHHESPALAITTLSLELLGLSEVTPQVSQIKYADYIKMFEESFKAFALTDTFWLIPPWDANNPAIPSNVHRLLLKPGLAFGTGRHPTSQMMVSFLEQNVQKDDIVFDLGCGSGILSIAAAILGAGRVQGVDVEKMAIESSRQNADLNQQSHPHAQIGFYTGDFLFYQDERFAGPPDIFIANILPNVFYQNQQSIVWYLTHCRAWALSGIIETQEDEFSQFLQKIGVAFNTKNKEQWLIFHSVS